MCSISAVCSYIQITFHRLLYLPQQDYRFLGFIENLCLFSQKGMHILGSISNCKKKVQMLIFYIGL